jgi:hypothetical protein
MVSVPFFTTAAMTWTMSVALGTRLDFRIDHIV